MGRKTKIREKQKNGRGTGSQMSEPIICPSIHSMLGPIGLREGPRTTLKFAHHMAQTLNTLAGERSTKNKQKNGGDED